MAVPYTFANATVSIPLSELDSNFATTITLGNTAIELGNTVTTLNNMTLANVTVSSGNATFTTANVTNMSSSNVTITGGTIANVTISGSGSNITATNINASNVTVSTDLTLSGGTANGVAYLNGSKVLTTGSGLYFNGTYFAIGGSIISRLAVKQQAATSAGGLGLEAYADASRLYMYSDGSTWVTENSVGGSGSYLPFSWKTAGSEQMRLTSTGLGIGTSSPSYKLDVLSGSTDAAALFNSANVNGAHVRFASSGTVKNYIGCAAGFVTSGSADDLGLRAVGKISFATNGAAADMTLDASGNLGLGVTPSAWGSSYKSFQVGKSAAVWGAPSADIGWFSVNTYFDNTNYRYVSSDKASYYQQYQGAHVWSTAPSGTAGNAITFTQAMTLDASGNLGIGVSSLASFGSGRGVQIATSSASQAASLYLQNGTTGTTGTDGLLLQMGSDNTSGYLWNFETGNLVFATANTERMRIDSSGNLLVGKTSDSQAIAGSKLSSTGAYFVNNGVALYLNQLASSGDIAQFRLSGSPVGSISVSGTSTAYNTSSDYRLKENIQPMQNALDVVSQLNPVTYTWKADGSDGQGFIAHELQAVVPDCVTGEKDAVDAEGNPVYQGVDTSFLVATLTAAIKELKAELDATKAEVAALK